MFSKSQPPNTAYTQYNARHDGATLQNPTYHLHGLYPSQFLPQACINEEDACGQFVDFDGDDERELNRRKIRFNKKSPEWVIQVQHSFH